MNRRRRTGRVPSAAQRDVQGEIDNSTVHSEAPAKASDSPMPVDLPTTMASDGACGSPSPDPARTMKHGRYFSNGLVSDARHLFQVRTGREVSENEAREMLARLTGFFRILIDWDIKSSKPGYDKNKDDGKRERDIKNFKR